MLVRRQKLVEICYAFCISLEQFAFSGDMFFALLAFSRRCIMFVLHTLIKLTTTIGAPYRSRRSLKCLAAAAKNGSTTLTRPESIGHPDAKRNTYSLLEAEATCLSCPESSEAGLILESERMLYTLSAIRGYCRC